jgi:hypothetical protein
MREIKKRNLIKIVIIIYPINEFISWSDKQRSFFLSVKRAFFSLLEIFYKRNALPLCMIGSYLKNPSYDFN